MEKQFTLEKSYEVTTTIKIVQENDKYYAKVHRNFDDLWQENDEFECWIEDNGELMTEAFEGNQEYDCVIETFCSYIKENGVKYARKCTKCNNGMNEGYIIGNGEYYCTDECLHKVYTIKEWEEMSGGEDNLSEESYWTEWETEEDFDYVLFDNKLITI
jgi:hypothetical protein